MKQKTNQPKLNYLMKKITLSFLLMLASYFSIAQNSCETALSVTSPGVYSITALDGIAPSSLCLDTGTTATTPAAEWYSYTATQARAITITTDITQNNPRVDTRMQVYTGTCGNLTCLTGDDDSGYNYSSIVQFNSVANTTYYFVFENAWSTSGFSFQIADAAIIQPPPTPISYNQVLNSSISSTYNLGIVDMDGDHKDDIVGVSANNLKIHKQESNGTFTVLDFPISGTSRMPTWSLAAGDYNRDGYNDLILGNGQGLSVWKSNFTNNLSYTSYTPADYIFCQRTNFVDLNNDGNLDLFSCHDVAPSCYYLNDGNSNLTFYQSTVTPGAMNIATSSGNYATLFTDLDNDGDSDVFVSKCSGPPCELYRNDGNGVYTNISGTAAINMTPIQSWSSAIADYDNDGDMDILIGSNGSVKNQLFRNNLDTTNSVEEAYTNVSANSGWDTNTSTSRDYLAFDFDNDGLLDVMSNGGTGTKIMFNLGNFNFSPQVYNNMSVGAIGDLNNDGFLDLLNGNKIFYATPNNNNWFKVSLNGTTSNSNGIGARIEIYGSFGKKIRDVRSGEGFAYMDSINAHFGLGQATEITQVVIKWPSGTVDTINNPAINQMLNVVEGSTLSNSSFSNTEFSLYPNPAKHSLNIKYNTSIKMQSAQVYDLNGKIVLKSDIVNDSINVDDLSTGTYLIMLKDENGKNYSQKFIKE